MSRQEDFIQAGIGYRFENGKPMAIGGDKFADVANEMNRCKDYEEGAEYGYQYAQTNPNWISVEDELPKENGRYWCCDDDDGQEELRWKDGHWYGLLDPYPIEGVTHWMQLPQPPRKEDKK